LEGDVSGSADFVDDATDLYRRVPPEHYKIGGGGPVIRDGAFKNFPNPERRRMSISLSDTLAASGGTPSALLDGYPTYGLVAIDARSVRAEDQAVERTPTTDDPAHGDVVGDKPASRRKRLAKQARWIVQPPSPPAETPAS
jgi:hypothetical protein